MLEIYFTPGIVKNGERMKKDDLSFLISLVQKMFFSFSEPKHFCNILSSADTIMQVVINLILSEKGKKAVDSSLVKTAVFGGPISHLQSE